MSAATAIDSRALAGHYSRFRVGERILLTGHSHQAWPDVALRGHEQAFADAADSVDHKWGRAFEKADRVRAGFRRLLGGIDGDIALASNTHELLARLISALPLRDRPEIIATDGEFHTVRRQLLRLAEEGIEVKWIPSRPFETIAARLAAAITRRTSLVVCSSVLFESARIVRGLEQVASAARAQGVEFLLDTYHHLNVVPFSPAGLETAFITGGGYKYCQLGEGNCFLRVPATCSLRPAYTGWFADFAALEGPPSAVVGYGTHPGARFAGATYDPVSHYRAAEVFDFFERENLSVERLRARSQEQLSLLSAEFDRLGLEESVLTRDRSVPLSEYGGFLSLQTPHAARIEARLKSEGLLVDHRGMNLRLGPAPYLLDEQLVQAIQALGRAARGL